MLDWLAESPAKASGFPAIMEFVTASDTVIDQKVLDAATDRGVLVLQRKAELITSANRPGEAAMRVLPHEVLNREAVENTGSFSNSAIEFSATTPGMATDSEPIQLQHADPAN